MNGVNNKLEVSKIEEGIVIDHIEAGKGYEMFKQLKLDKLQDVVVLMLNVPSKRLGRKDLIKIETTIELDLTVLGLVDPNITINHINKGKNVRKTQLTLPQQVVGILKCKNPRCITQSEKVEEITFFLANADKKEYRCEFCDTRTTII